MSETVAAQRKLAQRSVALRRRVDASGDADMLAALEERDFLEMDNCGWREISGEWAALARKLVPDDFDFGHGCAICTIGRVLSHLAGEQHKPGGSETLR